MSFGLNTYSPAGVLQLSLSASSLTLVDIVNIGASSGTKSYPLLVGWSLSVAFTQVDQIGNTFADVFDFTDPRVSISYPNGVPTVTYSPVAKSGAIQSLLLFVFGK